MFIMGVPHFFGYLLKKYKKNGFVFNKNITNKKILNEVNNINYILLDTNCLLHPVCFKVVADNSTVTNQNTLENIMFKEIILYIEKLINYVNPITGIYIAIDGVAPLAKIKQQRLRRFKSSADKILWNNIKKKYKKPIGTEWNNSAITPGTDFMVRLHNHILNWIDTKPFLNNKIIYSSCFTPSEGEHKLLQFIRNNNDNSLSYIIYGLDADLIFLALSTKSDKIYLLRESNEINKNESNNTLNYVSIGIMKEAIYETVTEKLNEDYNIKLKLNNVIADFIFICYFLGNDFLPHIPSLNIHNSGIEHLLSNYVKTLTELYLSSNKILYLLDNLNINYDFFKLFIDKLAINEEDLLKTNYHAKAKKMYCDSSDLYDKEIFKIENLKFSINDPIKLGYDDMESWRKRYYKYYWDVDEDMLEEFSKKLVYEYLLGIKWILLYYFDDCPSWLWFYPYEYPPFITDISKYKIDINDIKFKKGKPIEPFVQLLTVLPQQSANLLPVALRKLITNPKSSIYYMYPIKFEQDFINKHKYWMGIPKLPPLDIKKIQHSYNKYKNEIAKEEFIKNKSENVFIFD